MYIPSPTVLIQSFLVGCLFGLIGLGISLLYGVARVINWAYGNMFIFLMYFTWALARGMRIDPLLTVPAIVVLSFLLFFVAHKVIEPLVMREDFIGQLLVTLGISLIFYGLIYFIWGPSPKHMMTKYSLSTIKLGETIVQLPYLIIGLAGIIPIILIHIFVTKTWYGKAMRATAQNKMLVRICGIKPAQIYLLVTFFVALAAGLAAPFLFSLWGVKPTDGGFYISLAFVVTLLVKPGSIISALKGGIIISYAELLALCVLGAWAGGMATWTLFIILLLIRQSRLRRIAGV